MPKRNWQSGKWVRVLSAFLAGMLTAGTIGVTAAGAATATAGGNASGGSFANTAKSQKLVGPKGSGLTRGISSTTIKVGCVDTFSDYQGYSDGIAAAFAAANKSGVNGRKFTLVPCLDDANSPQTNLTDMQQLVNQNQVFSILDLSANTLPPSTNFVNQNQVPTFGWGFDPGFCGNRWTFGWNGCLAGETLPSSNPLSTTAQGSLITPVVDASGLSKSQVKIALQSDTLPASIAANTSEKNLFQGLGYKVVLDANNFPTSSTGVDYTPFVQSIMSSGANIVYLSLQFASIPGLAGSLRAAGYKGSIVDFTTYVPGLLASSSQLAQALQGELVNTQVVPQEGGGAYVAAELAALKAIGKPAFLTLGSSIGYAEAEELIQMVKASGKTLNTKTFDQAANGGKVVSFSNQPSGGVGKIQWPAGHYIATSCAAMLKISGTNYSIAKSFACYPMYSVKP
jgi:branched-chain amino acid transport system substrate-binding protein